MRRERAAAKSAVGHCPFKGSSLFSIVREPEGGVIGGERSGQGRHKMPGFRHRVGSEMHAEWGSDAISL